MPFDIEIVPYEATCDGIEIRGEYHGCGRKIEKNEVRLRYRIQQSFRGTSFNISKSCCINCMRKLLAEAPRFSVIITSPEEVLEAVTS